MNLRAVAAIAFIATVFSSDAGRVQRPAHTPSIPQEPSGVAQLKRANELNAAGKYAEAIAAYDSAATALPQIADWITLFAASSASYLGDTASVEKRVASVDDVLATEWAWRSRSRAFEKAGAITRAIDVARKAAGGGSASNRAQAWLRVAELTRASGDEAATRDALAAAIRAASVTEATLAAARLLIATPGINASERELAGRALMRNGEVIRGANALREILSQPGMSSAAQPQIRYDMGRALFGAGKYRDAAEALAAIPPSDALAADARFLLARSRYRLGKQDEGKRTFESVIQNFPTSRAATRALFFLADLAHDAGATDEAGRLFERAAHAPAHTSEAALANMRLGGMALLRKDYRKAAQIFDSYRKNFPNGDYRDQATYWSATSHLRAGDDSAGNALLDQLSRRAVSYYGMLAAQQRGDSTFSTDLPAGPVTSDTTAREVKAAIGRWQLLRDVEWNEAAAFELSRLRRRYSGDRSVMYALAEQLQQREAAHIAIAMGREMLDAGEPWNARMLHIMYPMPFDTLIKREAQARGLDPYFVAALIRQESRFNPGAVSGVGAIGLMQVMPATGRHLGRGTKVGIVTASTLTEPGVNIHLGTKFLADLMDMYDDRVAAVLVAYNAGPTRADRWKNFPEFGSEDLFVERIPFDETRDYVKIIKLNTAIYKAIYAARPAAD